MIEMHEQPPVCHGRPMLAITSRRTSHSAVDREKDTPVWWCPDCHAQKLRQVPS